jgi:hypothetical protein
LSKASDQPGLPKDFSDPFLVLQMRPPLFGPPIMTFLSERPVIFATHSGCALFNAASILASFDEHPVLAGGHKRLVLTVHEYAVYSEPARV